MFDWLNSAWTWASNASFTNLAGMFLYWVPVVICFLGYVVRMGQLYKEDVKRSTDEYYDPELTLGYILSRFVLCFIPIVNLINAIFNFIPYMLRDFIEWLEQLFDFPIVKHKYKPKRKEVNNWMED